MASFTPPHDKHGLIYMVFMAHGIGNLLAWNMFINAVDYFQKYKFSPEYASEPFRTADYFMQILTFVSMIPNVTCNWLNVFVQLKGGLEIRMITAILVIQAMFLVTIVLAMVDTSTWTPEFFYITMALVFVMNGANAIYQNCTFGIAAKLPSRYTGGVILGNNICGTFTSTIDVLSKLGTTNLRLSAIYYFLTAVFVLLLCMDSIYMLRINRFYSFQAQYQEKIEKEGKEGDKAAENKINYKEVFKQAWPQLINAFLTLFIAISIFPAVTSGIQTVNEGNLGRFFTSLTCFLTFNACAMIGSTVAIFFQWPKPKYLWICMVARMALIPLSLCCNYQPLNAKRKTPVLFKSDTVHWLLNVLNGLSNGYFTSLSMMYAPRSVEPRYAPIAGMLAAAFLITGIFFATCLTFLWPIVV